MQTTYRIELDVRKRIQLLPEHHFLPTMRLRGLLSRIFSGPLLLLLFDLLWRRRIAFEGVFDVAVSGLPNLVGVGIKDLHIGQHPPSKIARVRVNKVNAEGAQVCLGSVH